MRRGRGIFQQKNICDHTRLACGALFVVSVKKNSACALFFSCAGRSDVEQSETARRGRKHLAVWCVATNRLVICDHSVKKNN